MSRTFDCEERLFTDLHFAERAVAHGDMEFRFGNRSTARRDYDFAHGLVRRVFGTTRGCLTMGLVADPRNTLHRIVEVADKFEHLEQMIEGRRG